MAVSLDDLKGRVSEVLGQLELEVLDQLSELEMEAWPAMRKSVLKELIQAQRALREAELRLGDPLPEEVHQWSITN
jgi:hypothetical protein